MSKNKKTKKSKKISNKRPPVSKKRAVRAAPAKKAARKAAPKRVAARPILRKPLEKAAAQAAPAPKAIEPVQPPVLVKPEVPTRAPVRKIIGRAGSVTIAKEQVAGAGTEPLEAAPQALPTEVTPSKPNRPAPPRLADVFGKACPVPEQESSSEKQPAPAPKVLWTELPETLPPHIRFWIASALAECKAAEDSPFPFAKFISSLPQQMCGLEFALLILSLEHSPEEIAELCSLEFPRVEGLLESGRAHFQERLVSTCPEISRKWATQLTGIGVGVAPLVGKYLVAKVDRNFQLTLASIMLNSMGGQAGVRGSRGPLLAMGGHQA